MNKSSFFIANARCLVFLMLMICAVKSQELTIETFQQLNSCSSSDNALHIALEMDSTILKKDQPSITITGLVNTGLDNTGSITLVDDSKVFSNISMLFGDVALEDSTLSVDNSYILAVNDTIRIDSECLRITRVDGTGCAAAHVTHAGCVSVLGIDRAQSGTQAQIHFDGALVYKVVVATLTDSNVLEDGSLGIGDQQAVINLDSVTGFSNVSASGDACYCLIDEEILQINQVVHLRGTITSLVKGASGAVATTFPVSWNSADNYFVNMQLAFLDGVQRGRRRTVVQYDGRLRLATLDSQTWSIQVGSARARTKSAYARGAHTHGRAYRSAPTSPSVPSWSPAVPMAQGRTRPTCPLESSSRPASHTPHHLPSTSHPPASLPSPTPHSGRQAVAPCRRPSRLTGCWA